MCFVNILKLLILNSMEVFWLIFIFVYVICGVYSVYYYIADFKRNNMLGVSFTFWYFYTIFLLILLFCGVFSFISIFICKWIDE
jgi:succinate-acetate transporter protein